MAVSKRLRTEILRRDNSTCQKCGAKAPDVALVIDHVIPVTLGGGDAPANLQALCEPCNSGKSATPPDASTVAKVADDAARWSQAMQIAAKQMLASRNARSTEHVQFERWWSESTYGRTAPMYLGWERSVDAFLAAGLPLEILKDCVVITMSRKRNDAWKYLCAVAWAKVRELQAAARGVVAPVAEEESSWDSDDFHAGRHDVAKDLLANLSEKDLAHYKAYVLEWSEYPEDEIEVAVDMAQAAFSDLYHDRGRLMGALETMFALQPEQDVQKWRGQAEAVLRENLGVDFSDEDVLVHSAWIAKRDHEVRDAFEYLNTLDDAESREWLYCAAGALPEDASSEDIGIHAAAYARRNKANGSVMRGLCSARGDHGAMCPQPRSFLVYFANCPGCGLQDREICTGHGACERHTEEMTEGRFTSHHSGQLVELIDFKELDDE